MGVVESAGRGKAPLRRQFDSSPAEHVLDRNNDFAESASRTVLPNEVVERPPVASLHREVKHKRVSLSGSQLCELRVDRDLDHVSVVAELSYDVLDCLEDLQEPSFEVISHHVLLGQWVRLEDQ